MSIAKRYEIMTVKRILVGRCRHMGTLVPILLIFVLAGSAYGHGLGVFSIDLGSEYLKMALVKVLYMVLSVVGCGISSVIKTICINKSIFLNKFLMNKSHFDRIFISDMMVDVYQ